MATRKSVLEEKKFVTQKISDLMRYICFGLLAVYYTVSTSTSVFAVKLLESSPRLLIFVALLAALGILFDYLQFLCGWKNTKDTLKKNGDTIQYSQDFFWHARFWFFIAKQLMVISSATLFIVVIMKSIYSVT